STSMVFAPEPAVAPRPPAGPPGPSPARAPDTGPDQLEAPVDGDREGPGRRGRIIELRSGGDHGRAHGSLTINGLEPLSHSDALQKISMDHVPGRKAAKAADRIAGPGTGSHPRVGCLTKEFTNDFPPRDWSQGSAPAIGAG